MLKQILLSLITIFLPQQEITYTKEYLLNTESIPLNIYWISDDNILISYSNGAEIFNLENRARNSLDDCSNCIYGYDREILRCEYIHREIKSMYEFSTTVSIYDSKENLVLRKDLFPTVIPVICKKEYVVLKNAYSFLEKKTYYLDIQKSELEEISQKKSDIHISGLPKYRNISVGNERVILLTEENLLTVYREQK